MWNNDIMLFVVTFVLSIILIDDTVKSFFSEIIILLFSILQWSEAMSHVSSWTDEWDWLMGANLFVINALVAFVLMMLWLLERRKGESV